MLLVQAVADRGLRDAKWVEDVEGTYMRLDIPLIMPHLLEQLEERQLGEQLMTDSVHMSQSANRVWTLSMLAVRCVILLALHSVASYADTHACLLHCRQGT